MSDKTLHHIQAKLLKLLSENAEAPLTIRQLQEILSLSSPNLISHHLQRLERNGYLKRNPHNPRDYHIIKGGPESPVTHINLYGLAACSPTGSILDGNPIERIPIASRLLSFPASEAFMVKAQGKSMEPLIHEGDWVIARINKIPQNNRVFVCVNNGECIIKRIRFDKDRILLESTNKTNPEKFGTFVAAENFRVEGEVKSIISNKI